MPRAMAKTPRLLVDQYWSLLTRWSIYPVKNLWDQILHPATQEARAIRRICSSTTMAATPQVFRWTTVSWMLLWLAIRLTLWHWSAIQTRKPKRRRWRWRPWCCSSPLNTVLGRRQWSLRTRQGNTGDCASGQKRISGEKGWMFRAFKKVWHCRDEFYQLENVPMLNNQMFIPKAL